MVYELCAVLRAATSVLVSVLMSYFCFCCWSMSPSFIQFAVDIRGIANEIDRFGGNKKKKTDMMDNRWDKD